MYCDYYEEHVDEDDCYECEHDCQRKVKSDEAKEKREKELERLRSSELAIKIKQALITSLNLEEDKVDGLIVNLFDGAFSSAENQFKTLLNEIAKAMAIKYLEVKAKRKLDVIFEKALNDKVLLLAKNEEAQSTKIREIILNRTKRFFAEKDNCNSRNTIEKSIDSAIAKAVDSKVEAALKEITEEAIEKFNKEAMKKMMAGMVGAIQNDKRLLAVLGE